jgi:hypothetical protein
MICTPCQLLFEHRHEKGAMDGASGIHNKCIQHFGAKTIWKQDRQCTFIITMRCICATIAAVEKAISITYSGCVCTLTYPACNSNAQYYHLWPVWLYNILPHYLINGTTFEKKKVTEHRTCVLMSSTTFAWNSSHSRKKRARYDHKCRRI